MLAGFSVRALENLLDFAPFARHSRSLIAEARKRSLFSNDTIRISVQRPADQRARNNQRALAPAESKLRAFAVWPRVFSPIIVAKRPS